MVTLPRTVYFACTSLSIPISSFFYLRFVLSLTSSPNPNSPSLDSLLTKTLFLYSHIIILDLSVFSKSQPGILFLEEGNFDEASGEKQKLLTLWPTLQ
ncbi:hypothetical protein K7X08_013074 [Anisodus acutangulus]|uniref:Uncharacterized protein n=1 Tax=Anisodus acutangulus TaxID=402998 RepID=A0A9Q1MFD3_9SOLA|nr:hypothetical protein K7X08_013074 [Anisodus acutangulus]